MRSADAESSIGELGIDGGLAGVSAGRVRPLEPPKKDPSVDSRDRIRNRSVAILTIG